MVGGTDAFLVVVGCVGTTSAGGNSGLHWKIDLLIVCFGSICLGIWGSAEAQDNDLVPLTHTGWLLHHRGE
jgi:hypothetical protein